MSWFLPCEPIVKPFSINQRISDKEANIFFENSSLFFSPKRKVKIYSETLKLGADAGNISALDFGFMEKYGGIESDNNEYIDLKNGMYTVSLRIRESWLGDIGAEGIIEITGGKIAIGDACYNFDKGWDKFLDDTDYLKQYGKGGVILDTGGDGGFDVEVEIFQFEEK